jgi:hypothetical protein
MVYEKVSKAYQAYTGKKVIIGYSLKGKPLFAFHVGSPFGKQFIAIYAIHAREWITSYLALKHLKMGVPKGGGWLVPLVNPDGVALCESGKPLWKANARGVDLNCNFDALWGTGRLNTTVRGAQNCIGACPFSEPETLALKTFTLKIHPAVTFAFHTKGEEIYWEFEGVGDWRGAKILQQITGYTPKVIYGSAGGYKDWCIQKCHIPAYTIECGNDCLSHPLTKLKECAPCFSALSAFTAQYF